MLTEALEHLVRGIVDTPEAVRVDARSQRRGDMLEVRVAPEDLGRVIGRQGRTATALRTVLDLSLIHISEPMRHAEISYAVFCFKKKIDLKMTDYNNSD